MTIEQKRRELFEAAYQKETGFSIDMMQPSIDGDWYYFSDHAEEARRWFIAALDAVVIELPEPEMYFFDGGCHWAEDEYLGQPDIDRADPYGRIDKVRAAIESTGLGLRVMP